MVPKEFRKNLCVVAGWITLIEALVWGASFIYIVGVYGCSWSFYSINKGPNPWSMLYVTYIMGSCQGVQGALDLGYVFSPPTDPSRHLHMWLWVYMVLSVAWVPACILLTVAASVEVRGRQGALLYYPWMIISSVFIIVDLAGAVYHSIDILHSTTPDLYADLTANVTWSSLTMNSPTDDITPWLPSLFITLFFCRFLILWVINIVFLFGVYKGCSAVSLYTTKYLQSSLMPEENKKSWKTKFYQGPDPSLFEQTPRQGNQTEIRQSSHSDHQRMEDMVRNRINELGVPNEPQRPSDVIADQNEQERSGRDLRVPFMPGVVDYSGNPVQYAWFIEQRRDDNAPPIASGVQVPPELNKFEPFSYIAGDQPQRMKRPVSRSNSRGDQSQPPIPRPDYTLAERRAASLEYVPNRFRVPSPKRPLSQGNLNLDSAGRPINSKAPPASPKKPVVYPRAIPENYEMRYPQQAVGSQQQSNYARQAPAQNYNINKLY